VRQSFVTIDESAIEDWWRAFELQAPRIDAYFRKREDWDFAAWMIGQLDRIHPDLMWEFGPALHSEGHRLVITPEFRRHLRPLAQAVLDRAPALPGWEFYPYRLPEEYSQVSEGRDTRMTGGIDDISVCIQPGRFNRIDLRFVCSRWRDDDEIGRRDAFYATESLVGEELLDRWIGAIEVAGSPLPESALAIELRHLYEGVRQRIGEVEDQLPARPWFLEDAEEDHQWSLLEFAPQDADHYPEQTDIYVGVTVLPEMWLSAINGVPFDSVRWSRCGEVFCYLKIDGSNGLEGSRFADRAEIEDAINECLRPRGLGCVIGGGTGTTYSYVEVALMDPDQAWQALHTYMEPHDLPRRTWLLYHDSDLRALWHGWTDETPPPPMPNFE
jgi:hypothetical protein